MPPGENIQTDLHERIEILSAELEQARVAAEGVYGELAAVTRERDALASKLARWQGERVRAEAAVEGFHQTLIASLAALSAREFPDREADHEKFQLAMGELQVLAEELDDTNQALVRANRELDERESERTAALNDANRALEHANRKLAERFKTEAAARTAVQTQLLQAQKLESIGRLTGGVAHDFNNLLTVITSGLQLLPRAATAEHRDKLISRIEQAAWRGADLTRRLLAFARRQPLSPQRLEFAEHVQGVRDLLTHCVAEAIQIRIELPDNLWPFEVDLSALELAILNLAVNARDAMPDGGTMVLAARNVPASGGVPEQLGLADSDYVELRVTDTGTGMTPEVLERVFEPFFTTKPAGKGTGLGLAQVYGFAQQSGGTARVESPPGEGTSVCILLPRSIRAPEPVAPPSLPRMAHTPADLSVLVVEDDDEVAGIVLDMLHQLGHLGRRVASLPAAVAELSGKERFHVIFSDVLLGSSGSGLDLAREVARRQLPIPVVLTSGYGGGMTSRLAAGRLPFLGKPYNIDALRDVLARAVRMETAGSKE